MAKKNTEVVEINIDDLEVIEEAVIEVETQVDATPKATKTTSKASDVLDEIKKNAPEYPVGALNPKELDSIWQLGDQGRTVRRYLRKYFADNHEHKTGWALTKAETHEVIAFLTTKFGEPDFTKLIVTTTKEGK